VTAVTPTTRQPGGTAPAPITPTASDTVSGNLMGHNGCTVRVITTGTLTTVTIGDPGKTVMGNSSTGTAVTCPATGVREFPLPRAAIDPATNNATLAFSGALTGVTYELWAV